jgi:hypothetical protein
MLNSRCLGYPSNFLSEAAAKLIDLIAKFFDFLNTLGETIIGLPNTCT